MNYKEISKHRSKSVNIGQSSHNSSIFSENFFKNFSFFPSRLSKSKNRKCFKSQETYGKNKSIGIKANTDKILLSSFKSRGIYDDSPKSRNPFKKRSKYEKIISRKSSILEDLQLGEFSGKSLKSVYKAINRLTFFKNKIMRKKFYKKSLAFFEEDKTYNILTRKLNNNSDIFENHDLAYEKLSIKVLKNSQYFLELEERFSYQAIQYSLRYYRNQNSHLKNTPHMFLLEFKM